MYDNDIHENSFEVSSVAATKLPSGWWALETHSGSMKLCAVTNPAADHTRPTS